MPGMWYDKCASDAGMESHGPSRVKCNTRASTATSMPLHARPPAGSLQCPGRPVRLLDGGGGALVAVEPADLEREDVVFNITVSYRTQHSTMSQLCASATARTAPQSSWVRWRACSWRVMMTSSRCVSAAARTCYVATTTPVDEFGFLLPWTCSETLNHIFLHINSYNL